MKIYAHKKTCTQKFIAVLFILEKTPETMQMSISGWLDKENGIPSIWKNYAIKDSSHKRQSVVWFRFYKMSKKGRSVEKK